MLIEMSLLQKNMIDEITEVCHHLIFHLGSTMTSWLESGWRSWDPTQIQGLTCPLQPWSVQAPPDHHGRFSYGRSEIDWEWTQQSRLVFRIFLRLIIQNITLQFTLPHLPVRFHNHTTVFYEPESADLCISRWVKPHAITRGNSEGCRNRFVLCCHFGRFRNIHCHR